MEFFPERFPHGAFYGKTLGVDIHRFGEYMEGDVKFREMEAIAGSEDELDESFFDRFSGEREQLLDIIRSIEQDDRKVYSVNIPNRGAVPNLPTDAVLEMPAWPAPAAFFPSGTPVPGILAAIVARQLSIVELTVDAALRGDRRLMVERCCAEGTWPIAGRPSPWWTSCCRLTGPACPSSIVGGMPWIADAFT